MFRMRTAGCLTTAHLSLAIFAFAVSGVLSGHVAFQVYFEAVPIQTFQTLFVVYLVLMELICLGPLLIFTPLLARTRREGLRQYSLLANTYNRAFERKWVAGQAPPDEPLLGSSDIQSLADLGNSFGMIREMRLFPFNGQQILQIAGDCVPARPASYFPGDARGGAAETARRGAAVSDRMSSMANAPLRPYVEVCDWTLGAAFKDQTQTVMEILTELTTIETLIFTHQYPAHDGAEEYP